jgi:hypothetical protein
MTIKTKTTILEIECRNKVLNGDWYLYSDRNSDPKQAVERARALSLDNKAWEYRAVEVQRTDKRRVLK